MATHVTKAPDLAAHVKPVRALFRKNLKINAIKLVRERTDCGLKECKEFVEHVQDWPRKRAEKVAELWIAFPRDESIATEALELEPAQAAMPDRESANRGESTHAEGMSLAESHVRYETERMLRHVESCAACQAATKLADRCDAWCNMLENVIDWECLEGPFEFGQDMCPVCDGPLDSDGFCAVCEQA
jgi:hypothetical protein